MRILVVIALLIFSLWTVAGAPSSEVSHDEDSTYIFDAIEEIGGIEGIKKVIAGLKGGEVDPLTCIICEALLKFFQDYLRSGKSIEKMAKIWEGICIFGKIVSPPVCIGAIQEYKKEVSFIIENTTVPFEESCRILLSPECGPLRSKAHNWTVPLPDVPKPPVKPFPKPKNVPVTRVLQIADTHFDPEYLEGSSAVCEEPLCCQKTNGMARHPDEAAGKWGDHRDCDIPVHTFENMVDRVKNNHKIDYIIWTGDLPPHDVWKVTKKNNIEILNKTSEIIRENFPDIPVYPAVGNHEPIPCNTFPIEEAGSFNLQWLYDALADIWSAWLPNSTLETIRRGGFYSVKVKPGLKLISLNNNYCYKLNWWLSMNSTDPFGQLAWLVQELQESENIGEKVHIIGHIPPGLEDCIEMWSENFNKIITRYESTVTAQFYGHTHLDEFEIFYDPQDQNRATSIAYIAPSVTTFTGMSPSYRIYSVDGKSANASYTVVDHETYTFNLTEANKNGRPEWFLEYRASEDLTMDSLTPADWDDLLNRFQTNDALFKKFLRYYRRPAHEDNSPCNLKCKEDLICQLRTSLSRSRSKC